MIIAITLYGLTSYALGVFVGIKSGKAAALVEKKVTVKDLRPRD